MAQYHVKDRAEAPPIVERTPAVSTPLFNDPIVDRVLRNRGICSADEVDHDLARITRPETFKDMVKAAEIIVDAREAGERILIIGDYDCDGATSVATLVDGLSALGFEPPQYLIPDRMEHGYGLSTSIAAIGMEYAPDLVVTVDAGISNVEGAKVVKDAGAKLVITDHHLPPASGILPDADALVNPNQPDCDSPYKTIAGCGVALFVALSVRNELRRRELPGADASLAHLLDLTAVGTVADLVALDYDNRSLVSAGINRINKGNARPGIRAIMDLAGVESLTSEDIAFQVGPYINAAGRLSSMSLGVECLLATERGQAIHMAEQLKEINDERKARTREMKDQARTMVEETAIDTTNYAIVVYDSGWHEGIIGLVASQLKEMYNRPIIAFTNAETAEGERPMVKGSARSIGDVHMKHLLDTIAGDDGDMLSKYGGHAMAAGLSIPLDRLDDFRSVFNARAAEIMTEDMVRGEVAVDWHNPDESVLSVDTVERLLASSPFGAAFDAPQFSADFEVIETKTMGRDGDHLRFVVRMQGGERAFEAVGFFGVKDGEIQVGEAFTASFKLSINRYFREPKLQLLLDTVITDPATPRAVPGQQGRAAQPKPAPDAVDEPAKMRFGT